MPRAVSSLAGLATAIALTTAGSQLTVLAHQTQISDDIGGTHHIEPNDTPKAGEPSQTWFALTQAGGKSIGLADCDCQLELLEEGDEGQVIAQPELTAIAVEGLTDVPAAELTFPKVGAYRLRLSGQARGEADFAAFQLDFPVTVAAGTKAAIAPQASATAERERLNAQATTPDTSEGEESTNEMQRNKGSILPVATGLAGLVILIGLAISRSKS